MDTTITINGTRYNRRLYFVARNAWNLDDAFTGDLSAYIAEYYPQAVIEDAAPARSLVDFLTPATLGDPGQPGRRYAPAMNRTLETYLHRGRVAAAAAAGADATFTPAGVGVLAAVLVGMTDTEYAGWVKSSNAAAEAYANRDRYVHADHVAEADARVADNNDGGPVPTDLAVKFQPPVLTYGQRLARAAETGCTCYPDTDPLCPTHTVAADLRDKRIAGF